MKYFPLVCVYRFHEVIRNKRDFTIERIVFKAQICGAAAPRNRSKLNEPAFPNRFGDPLCERHKIWANNKEAFPGVKEDTKIHEEEKTGVGRIDRLGNFDDLISFLERTSHEMDNSDK